MDNSVLPPTMRIWRYDSADGGLENHLVLHKTEPLPRSQPDQHLVQVLAVGLNPVDFKPAEAGIIGRIAVKKPATPGFDFAGRIMTPAKGSNSLKGQLVFGASSSNPLAGGALAEYIAVPDGIICEVPSGITPLVAAGIPVAATTAYASLIPYVRSGSRVFVNGGSGGVGTYAIQIAKAVGAHVTVSCSARNADLCRSLGADEVLDYTSRPLLSQLRDAAAAKQPFDHTVDNVFSDAALYYEAHTYSTPNAKFAFVASGPSLAFLRLASSALFLPRFLGGGRRKFIIVASDNKREVLKQVADWIVDGTIKPVTDRVYPMEDVVEAFKRLKTGRATGKVIVNVAGEGQ